MGTMIGFVLGYVLGTRAGEQGWNDLLESWRTISSSDEVRDLLVGGLSIARDYVRQGAGMMADRLDRDERGSELRVA
ncbi:MAG: hypothetical protein QOJ44_1621 [Acidimicrobiaceae bacterium]|jgi:hypothetical protein|nr:hypothetical protein [Acidimicrobiaceae bacterium]